MTEVDASVGAQLNSPLPQLTAAEKTARLSPGKPITRWPFNSSRADDVGAKGERKNEEGKKEGKAIAASLFIEQERKKEKEKMTDQTN